MCKSYEFVPVFAYPFDGFWGHYIECLVMAPSYHYLKSCVGIIAVITRYRI